MNTKKYQNRLHRQMSPYNIFIAPIHLRNIKLIFDSMRFDKLVSKIRFVLFRGSLPFGMETKLFSFTLFNSWFEIFGEKEINNAIGCLVVWLLRKLVQYSRHHLFKWNIISYTNDFAICNWRLYLKEVNSEQCTGQIPIDFVQFRQLAPSLGKNAKLLEAKLRVPKKLKIYHLVSMMKINPNLEDSLKYELWNPESKIQFYLYAVFM